MFTSSESGILGLAVLLPNQRALHKANIEINRKTLAHLAWHDSDAFAKLVEIAKG